MRQLIATLLLIALVLPLRAQESVNQAVIANIKTEGFQHSKAMDTLSWLSDVYGPRVKGTPNYKAAAEWSRARLAQWGLSNATLEAGGYTGLGWTVERYSIEMIAPQYSRLLAAPLAWSPNTNGTVAGNPIVVEINTPEDCAKYKGKLKGAIVMNGRPAAKPTAHFEADARRFNDDALARAAQSINPGQSILQGSVPGPYLDGRRASRERTTRRAAIAKFFRDEGVAALLIPSVWDSGWLLARTISMDAGGFDMNAEIYNYPNPEFTVPTFVVAHEHYGRMLRLMEKNIPVKVELSLTANLNKAAGDANVIAELPGSDPRLKDEIVMLGGHLDSWHLGTGATDNAAGCAVMMEALRILKAIDAKPRRTIRIGLWNGEEGGLYGSYAYVRQHFGDPTTLVLKPAHEKLSAYFNLDNGTGKIRGVYLQGNEAVRPIFAEWLKPFHYLGASTLAIQSVGGTDHLPFDYIGLPGFQFIQDEIDYETRTHHSNMDVYEAVQEDDLKQAAVVVASFAYHTAMRDEKLPRKPLPKK